MSTTVDGALIVSYWSDKTSSTTAWDAPPSQTLRHDSYGSGGGRMSGFVTDSTASVSPGSYGDLTAVANSANDKATMWTIALAPRE